MTAAPAARRAAASSQRVIVPAGEVVRVLMTLPGVPESVSQFRELVRERSLSAFQADTAELLVSELATNAIRYTPSGKPGGTVTVLIEPGPLPGEMRVTVRDASTAPWRPACGPFEIYPEHGWGLEIVGTLAVDWGIDDAAHAVWCEISAEWSQPVGQVQGTGSAVAS